MPSNAGAVLPRRLLSLSLLRYRTARSFVNLRENGEIRRLRAICFYRESQGGENATRGITLGYLCGNAEIPARQEPDLSPGDKGQSRAASNEARSRSAMNARGTANSWGKLFQIISQPFSVALIFFPALFVNTRGGQKSSGNRRLRAKRKCHNGIAFTISLKE